MITGFSPHFRILAKLRQTEENEQIKRVKYQILEEVESSYAIEDKSTIDSMDNGKLFVNNFGSKILG